MGERMGSVGGVAAILRGAASIGVVGHVGPDGDALGSMIALTPTATALACAMNPSTTGSASVVV